MKKTKKSLIFAIVLRLVGIFILIQGIRMVGEGVYNYIDEHNQQDWISISAEVIDISSEYSSSSRKHSSRVRYDITYEYEVDGKTYSDKLYNRDKAMALGDKVKVKYDPDAPENSTNILSPSLNNLIVFLVFGTIFAAMGFFLSGAWALIHKIRNRGKTEEEILPPEEYIAPEIIKKEPKSSTKMIVRNIVITVIALCAVFLSIKLFSGTQEVDTDRFKEVVENAGYTTTDTTYELSQNWKVGSMMKEAVSFNDGNIRMDFCVMDTADSASVVYNGMILPISDGEKQEHDGIVHELYSVENDSLYVAKIRIRDTVIYVSAQTEYKSDVVELLEELGYWKGKK